MKRSIFVLSTVVVFLLFSSPAISWADPTWDILEEYYGNGLGQVSFNNSFDYDDAGYMDES